MDVRFEDGTTFGHLRRAAHSARVPAAHCLSTPPSTKTASRRVVVTCWDLGRIRRKPWKKFKRLLISSDNIWKVEAVESFEEVFFEDGDFWNLKKLENNHWGIQK